MIVCVACGGSPLQEGSEAEAARATGENVPFACPCGRFILDGDEYATIQADSGPNCYLIMDVDVPPESGVWEVSIRLWGRSCDFVGLSEERDEMVGLLLEAVQLYPVFGT